MFQRIGACFAADKMRRAISHSSKRILDASCARNLDAVSLSHSVHTTHEHPPDEAQPFNGTSRAAHRAAEHVHPGTATHSVEDIAAQVSKAKQAMQHGAEHAEGGLQRGEEVFDEAGAAISRGAHDLKGKASHFVQDAKQATDYTKKEAQDLYNRAAHSAEEAAAPASKGKKFDAAEAILSDPLYLQDEEEAVNAARKGAGRRPGMGVRT